MNNHSFSEMADMHLVLGECEGNGTAAARRYAHRNVPDKRIFLAIDLYITLRETDTLKKQVVGNSGRTKELANADDIIEIVDEHPDMSMRKIAAELRVPRMKVWRTVKDQLLQPFHIT